jgi:hypothetical protein
MTLRFTSFSYLIGGKTVYPLVGPFAGLSSPSASLGGASFAIPAERGLDADLAGPKSDPGFGPDEPPLEGFPRTGFHGSGGVSTGGLVPILGGTAAA